MAIRELPKSDWSAYFDAFSKSPDFQQAELEVSSLGLGDQIQAEWVRIGSVTYDHNLQHLIHQPKSIFIDEANGLLARFETVDAGDVRHIVQLRGPLKLASPIAVPDKVDEAGMESFPASDPPPWN